MIKVSLLSLLLHFSIQTLTLLSLLLSDLFLLLLQHMAPCAFHMRIGELDMLPKALVPCFLLTPHQHLCSILFIDPTRSWPTRSHFMSSCPTRSLPTMSYPIRSCPTMLHPTIVTSHKLLSHCLCLDLVLVDLGPGGHIL